MRQTSSLLPCSTLFSIAPNLLSLRLGQVSSSSPGWWRVMARPVSRARSRSELTARENFSPASLCPTYQVRVGIR